MSANKLQQNTAFVRLWLATLTSNFGSMVRVIALPFVAILLLDAKPMQLATLNAAAAKLTPGDTCFIRGGAYAEPLEIVGLKGTANAPIVFRAYQDEKGIFSDVRFEASPGRSMG